ncbi:MAG: DNA internalization-related competence protein ComEC/Rec2 [Betaproteobacteria bacterium]|nr:DNA internalization-related competence protein ComEC/Rec2 [Betaproteobacteria bacterium]
MHTFLSGVVAGVLLLQCSPRLFPWGATLGVALLFPGAVLWGRQRLLPYPGLRWVLLGLMAVLLGFSYANLRAQWRLSEALPSAWEGQDVTLSGLITELPESVPNGVRFTFEVARVDPASAMVPRRLSLAWFSSGPDAPVPELHPGQHWQLHCRLKRPHSQINPGGFDFEAWSLAQGIRAVGTVQAAGDNRLLPGGTVTARQHPGLWIEQAREAVRQRIQSVLGERRWSGVVVALVVGDQSLIRQDDWQLFWITGVGHLVSISGLHITMLAGLVAQCAGGLWPSVRVRWVAGLLGALAYALLAGFSVPTQRTLYMIGVVTLVRFRDAPPGALSVLLLALATTVVVDPWAPLSVGFWLSFGAVGALMYAGAHTVGREGALKAAIHTQWSATWALVPLLLLLFGQVSLLSPLANAFAIPVVSLGVVPLALLGTIPGLGDGLIAAHQLFAACAWALQQMAQWPVTVWTAPTPAPVAFLAGVVGLLFLLAPKGLPGRWVGSFCLLVLLLLPRPRPEPGGVWMDVLDVGQGLAVVVRTQNHALVYDTGPRYSAESDGGSRVLLPALRALGVDHLEGLIVSHRDTDHSGGAQSLQKGIPIDWLLSSLEPAHPLVHQMRRSIPCFAGQHWEWDGVRFDILHPLLEQVWDEERKTNDRGCVLRITAQGQRLLLPADIEALSEEELLQRSPEALAAEVLIAPHHGSKTSSTPGFLDAVSPRWAIFTVGYRNHFGHPKPAVVARYQERQIQWLRTDQTGAIALTVEKNRLTVTPARSRFPHYWEEGLTPLP